MRLQRRPMEHKAKVASFVPLLMWGSILFLSDHCTPHLNMALWDWFDLSPFRSNKSTSRLMRLRLRVSVCELHFISLPRPQSPTSLVVSISRVDFANIFPRDLWFIATNLSDESALFRCLKPTPMSTLVKAVSELVSDSSLTGKVAEISGENVTWPEAPDYVDEVTKYNLEMFWTLGVAWNSLNNSHKLYRLYHQSTEFYLLHTFFLAFRSCFHLYTSLKSW